MKHTFYIGAVSLVLTSPVFSNEESKPSTAQKQIEQSEFVQCDTQSKSDKCGSILEVIEVRGDKINPISFSSKGRYNLNRKMIEDYRFGNGNLNEVLAILPGVQYAESAQSADQVSNIRPSEVSISGASGAQTAYLIDGVSNNSLLNDSSVTSDKNLADDVVGHSQEIFLNLELVESIEVYDSNVPAKYGAFSGGIVIADTRKIADELKAGFSFRKTADSFVKYNRFYSPRHEGRFKDEDAVFEKSAYSAYVSSPITADLSFLAQIQLLSSKESVERVGDLKIEQQENYNALLKFEYELTANDSLTLNLFHGPYSGEYFAETAKNSPYSEEGGGQKASLKWEGERSWGAFENLFVYKQSQNSKDAPTAWFVWLNQPGKALPESHYSKTFLEGGFGDIEKNQRSVLFKHDFEFSEISSNSLVHQTNVGFEYEYLYSQFNRLDDSIAFNDAVSAANINCAGYTIDCIESEYKKPLSQLEEELGRPLDFTDESDLLLYSENIIASGQYFQGRTVIPAAESEANMNKFSAYVDHEIQWQDLVVATGFRYDFNDFFKNHNVSPRFRGSYNFFDDDAQFVFGASRYYSNDGLNYKLNEAKLPTYNEYRAAFNNRVLNWQSTLKNRGHRHVYEDLKTPYSDEFTLAYRHQLFGGTVELKWINRRNKDQINREKGFNDSGESILYGANSGYSQYDRYSLSWMASFDNQHVQFNVSHVKNVTDEKTFDGEARTCPDFPKCFLNFDYNTDELVFLANSNIKNASVNYEHLALVTKHDLDLVKKDFNRPIIANLSWGGRFGNWSVSSFIRYHSKQDALYNTGATESVKSASSLCDGCQPSETRYPVYSIQERPAYWLLSGSIKYSVPLVGKHTLSFSFEGENLLNKRTYQVAPFSTGLELGRRFWLGLNYSY
ncbi:hypothetical protein CWC21_08985 [Pseudoalteromonas phenolica]|nr:hypothetical protein CWC21_08985 [Pseudoalteromonas phenolica]